MIFPESTFESILSKTPWILITTCLIFRGEGQEGLEIMLSVILWLCGVFILALGHAFWLIFLKK